MEIFVDIRKNIYKNKKIWLTFEKFRATHISGHLVALV